MLDCSGWGAPGVRNVLVNSKNATPAVRTTRLYRVSIIELTRAALFLTQKLTIAKNEQMKMNNPTPRTDTSWSSADHLSVPSLLKILRSSGQTRNVLRQSKLLCTWSTPIWNRGQGSLYLTVLAFRKGGLTLTQAVHGTNITNPNPTAKPIRLSQWTNR